MAFDFYVKNLQWIFTNLLGVMIIQTYYMFNSTYALLNASEYS